MPLIVDIVDSHGVYQGQWCKRKAYYRKCAYKMESASAKEQAVKEEVAPLTTTTTRCLLLDD
jgi:hypothetical protein